MGCVLVFLAEFKKLEKEDDSRRLVEQAASVCLATAAVKAKSVADVEERRMKGLVAQVIEAQLRRLEIKLKQFDELEALLDQEHQKVADYVKQEMESLFFCKSHIFLSSHTAGNTKAGVITRASAIPGTEIATFGVKKTLY